jgi:hypothetical protein
MERVMSDRACDLCGKTPARRVLYGYPSPELIERARRGEVILGGCLIGGEQPNWLCRKCESLREDLLDSPEDTS